MITAGALMLGAVLLGWLAPVPLNRLSGRGSPGVELTRWLALAAGVFTSASTGAILLLLGDRPHVAHESWEACWAILGHSHVHPLDEVAGMLFLAMVFLTTARVATTLKRRVATQRQVRRAHLALADVSPVSHVDGVLWLEHDAPFAYSIAGKPGLVVASTALNRLPAEHREAVLRHEHHHLRHRHHFMVMVAEALSDALPRIPLFRATARAARSLTELSADHSAAHDCGAEAVCGALLALGRAERSATLRLQRLRGYARRPTMASHIVALATSSVLPMVLGGALVGVVITLAC